MRLALLACSVCTLLPAAELTLWYDAPAAFEKNRPGMDRALPIGNGTQGSLVFGGVADDRLAINHISLWTGDANPSGDYKSMGEYRSGGEVQVDFTGQGAFTAYRRELDLASAVARVTYAVGPTTFTREYFASHPDQVQVARYTASAPGAFSGTVALKDLHGAEITADGHGLKAVGKLKNGMEYGTQVRLVAEGGTVAAGAGKLTFSGCTSLTLLWSIGTDYVMDGAKGWKGPAPHPRLAGSLDAAAARPYADLKAAHVAEYRRWFDRVAIDLGATTPAQAALTSDKRTKLAAEKGDDPAFAALLFQYGRYLLISCSRPGGLPANLQGLWNDVNNPAWHSDYHTNINIQMNYWLAEVANLSECHLPLFDLIESQIPDWRKATAVEPLFKLDGKPAQGWTVRTSHNIHGGMGWNWDNTSNAWYGLHFWEHYAFTRDEAFLRQRAYPLLKEVAQFWDARLKTLPDGRLVVPNGWSPEHGPKEDGVSYSQQIVHDLFTNYLEAADALKIDPEYRERIAGLRAKLVGPQIGKWKQLQEWMTDRDDPKDHHRHTSHLFAVFPGRWISPAQTPEFAAAAKVSLDARGATGDVREWSCAWRTALYARLRDGEAAGQMVREFEKRTTPNLFGNHPPMQIDGNFGIVGGMCEMLVQSHAGAVELLPALPKAWATGSVNGLKARGNVTVDLAWKDGALTGAVLSTAVAGPVVVRLGATTVTLAGRPGGVFRLDPQLKSLP